MERCHVGCMSTYCCCDKSVPDLVEKQKKMIDVDTKVAQKSRTIHSSILEDHAIIIIMSCCSWFFVCISYRIMHWKRNNALEYLLKCKRQFSSWTLDPIFSHAILTTSQALLVVLQAAAPPCLLCSHDFTRIIKIVENYLSSLNSVYKQGRFLVSF